MSLLSGTRVGDIPTVPTPDLEHTSGAWVAGLLAGTHRASQKKSFRERWVAGFVEVEDASNVAKPPKYARMLLGDGGMPLGWCDKRFFLLAFIALPPTCRMSEPRKNKKENTGWGRGIR